MFPCSLIESADAKYSIFPAKSIHSEWLSNVFPHKRILFLRFAGDTEAKNNSDANGRARLKNACTWRRSFAAAIMNLMY